MSRERDVRNAIMDALRATGEFDVVNTGQDKKMEASGDGAFFVHVDPHDARLTAHWDEGGQDGVEIISHFRLTLTVVNDDTETRDGHLERLLNITQNIVNDQALAELTLPAFTRIFTWRWLPPKAPHRQVEALLEYHYLLDTSTDFDTID